MDLISATQADQSSEKKIKNLATDFQVEWRLRSFGDVTRLIALQTGPAPVMRFYHSSTRVVHITGLDRITGSILWSTALHKAEDHRSATSSPRNWSPRWWKRFNMSPLWMFAWLSLLKSSLFFSALIVLDASMFACARPCAALRFELFYWTPRAFNFPFSAI